MPAFGAATNLAGGTVSLTLPVGCRYWFFQAQGANPMKVVMAGQDSFNSVIVNPHSSGAGFGGDLINSVDFPFFVGTITVTGTGTDQFGSGATTRPPNAYGGAV